MVLDGTGYQSLGVNRKLILRLFLPFLGELPSGFFCSVFAFGQEYVDGVFLGVDPLDEAFELAFSHSRAAEGCL